VPVEQRRGGHDSDAGIWRHAHRLEAPLGVDPRNANRQYLRTSIRQVFSPTMKAEMAPRA
jgi:hypothetical protein